MKFIYLTLVLLFCKISPPCSALDPYCNLVSSIIIENSLKQKSSELKIGFQPPEGSYITTQFIKLSSNNPNIRYTIDNTSPTCNSTTYSSPIPLTAETNRIIAGVCENGVMSQITSANYSIKYSIARLPNLSFWYSSLSLNQSENSRVSSWTDLSPNKNHLSGASTIYNDSNRDPVFVTNQINGQPVVRFTSSSKQFLFKNNLSSVSNTTSGLLGILIRKNINSSANELITAIGSATQGSNYAGTRRYSFLNTSNQIQLCSQAATPICSVSPSNSLQTGRFEPIFIMYFPTNTIFYAGTFLSDVATTAVTSFNIADTLTLGSPISYSPSSDFLNADIVEFFYLDRTFNEAVDQKTINCYIKEKYKINTTCDEVP